MPKGSLGICAIDCTTSSTSGIATQSQAQLSWPGSSVDGICRATCHQPSAIATAATGTAIINSVRMLAFITEAAATASGEGASRAATASRVSASPSARRGAS